MLCNGAKCQHYSSSPNTCTCTCISRPKATIIYKPIEEGNRRRGQFKMLSPKNGTIGTPKQPGQPIESWTTKTIKSGDRSRQNGLINSPRGLYGRSKVPVSAGKRGVGGEWALKECEEHTAWLNGILKKHKSRPIGDLRKSISDGLTLVNILEILFNGKINGVQTRPIIRAQRLENINLCLKFLEDRGVEIQHISADELTEGNLRATLSLVTCLRKRFEAFHTSNSAHGEGSSASIDRSTRPPTEDSIRPPLGREASIHSYNSQHSIHSQHSDGLYSRQKNSEIPATIQSDEELSLAVSPPVNGDADHILPGTLADSDPDEPRPESTDKNDNFLIPSVTELDSQGVSQHGANSRKQKILGSRPPFTKTHSMDGHGSTVSSGSHVRDTISQSVEDKLRTLLDSPSPGGRPANRQLIDDGELLELPPPRLPSYHDDGRDSDEDGINEEMTFEEIKLQAMLEDPDNFDDYPKDWDRYISGYVPSHSAEKSEGPRAQRLLDRQPAQPSPTPASQQKPLPFFHAPPSQHMGPVQNTAPMNNQSPYPNGSQSMPSTDSWGYSGMYDSGRRSHQYNGPPLDPRMQQYYPGEESPPQRRKLPSYTDHIQRYPPKQRMSNGNSPGTMFGPEESRMQNNPMWPPPGFARDWQDARRPGYEQRLGYPVRRDYDQQAIEQDHQRVRQYLNHGPSRASPNHQGIPMEDLSRRSDYRYPPSRKKSDPNSSYTYRDHPIANSRMQQGYLRNSRDNGPPMDFSFSPNDDSSRSSTPPLPPLSPDNSDDDSLPGSPYLGKKSQRSISVGALPSSLQLPSNKLLNDSLMGMKKRKGNSSRGSNSPHRTFEPRSSARRSMGKGRRKGMTKGGKSNNSNIPASGTASNKRKSPNSRALPPVPLHKLQEHTEHTDSDLSSHHSDRRSNSDDDSEPISRVASLPSKPNLKIRGTANQQQQQSATESTELPDADSIRQQLVALENMYQEILSVIANEQREQGLGKPGDRLSVSSLNTTAAKIKAPSSAKATKRREKDFKLVNKRFARVESHVVTLARSVAHLSSEMRSQSVLFHEIEGLRLEIDQIRDIQAMNSNISPSGGMRFRPIVPLSSSPQRIKKLTKFFGEEPPLLTMFLQELGYQKYAPLFEKEDIGMVELPYLSEERLEGIGIPTGPRLRILQEAQLMV